MLGDSRNGPTAVAVAGLAGFAVFALIVAGCDSAGRRPAAADRPAPVTVVTPVTPVAPVAPVTPVTPVGRDAVPPAGPAAAPEPWLLGTEWERIPTDKKIVALTFDAGGDATAVRRVLETLADRDVRATFFLTGAWTRAHPVKARAIAAGYRVGSHGMTHREFTTLTAAKIRRQLSRAADAISDVCGVSPAPLFRFPYGDRDARTIKIVNRAGYVPVRWTVDTLGWQGTSGGATADSVVQRVVDNLQPGEIVLMHVGANPDDGSTLDADALRRVIRKVRGAGYRLVSLRALLTATWSAGFAAGQSPSRSGHDAGTQAD